MRINIRELEGRDHYVVPMILIVVGVHNGSVGPIYYPADELKRSAQFWNSRPIVVYHPEMYSGGFAGNPQVFNRQKIGYVFNTTFDGERLKAEAWIDVEKVKRVDNRVLHTIQNSQMMEVSTGLVSDIDGRAGTFRGKEYHSTVRNLKPDHLAVLPDQVGACSIAAGAGLVRNTISWQEALMAPVMTY